LAQCLFLPNATGRAPPTSRLHTHPPRNPAARGHGLHLSASEGCCVLRTNERTHINNSQPGGRQRCCGGSFSGKRLSDAGARETFDVNPGDTFLRTTISGSRRQKEKKARASLVLRVEAEKNWLLLPSERLEIISNSPKVYPSCLLHLCSRWMRLTTYEIINEDVGFLYSVLS
jgi:hypothetical protein